MLTLAVHYNNNNAHRFPSPLPPLPSNKYLYSPSHIVDFL